MRVFLAAVLVAALVVGSARAEGPPVPPPGNRPILSAGEPATAAGLLATHPWAVYDEERRRFLIEERDVCLRKLEGAPPPGGWRPVLVIGGVSVTLGLAGGLWLGAKLWRR
jgi:hypothetical protein